MSESNTVNQLTWRSRRGMLELELLLQPFVRSELPRLSAEELQLYARLLEHDDWDIFEWLQGREDPADETLLDILERVRRANQP
jgi:antitoxin CptB